MNTDTVYKTSSSSPADTSMLGERIAKLIPAEAVIELVSDLGGGKTTLVKGLARGLGITEVVASPTYTLSREYDMPDGRQLHHYDFYRLVPGDIVAAELGESLAAPGVITAIEWPEQAGADLPTDRLVIAITATTEDSRSITITATGPISQNIVTGLKS